jgi:hypothetical protein
MVDISECDSDCMLTVVCGCVYSRQFPVCIDHCIHDYVLVL